jgi:hypothetical protein
LPYSPAVRGCLICALVALAPAQGRADGIAIVGGSPRAIGRAGAATVGDDGGGALLINPAAMARRDTMRIELGASATEDDIEWQSDADGSPRSVGRAGSRAAPLGAVIGAIGSWVIGIGAMTAAVVDRSLPRPSNADPSTALDLANRYNYRYAGIAGSYRRDAVALGLARRVGDSLALGVSFAAARVSVVERRRIFASPTGEIGTTVGDVDLTFTAHDPISESAVAGLLYASNDAPIELGVSVAWTRTVELDGTVTATETPLGPRVTTIAAPSAAMHVTQPLALRAGGRYVGDRVVAELDGDLWLAARGSESTTWSVNGIRVLDPTRMGVDLSRIPSRIAQRTHVTVRAALDLAVVPGFLWATAGYAFATRATPADRMSPSFGDLGGHTLGLGLEATSGGVTATLGWSRTWASGSGAASAFRLDNPFHTVDGPVLPGKYYGQIDQVGVLVDAEFGGH